MSVAAYAACHEIMDMHLPIRNSEGDLVCPICGVAPPCETFTIARQALR